MIIKIRWCWTSSIGIVIESNLFDLFALMNRENKRRKNEKKKCNEARWLFVAINQILTKYEMGVRVPDVEGK